MMQGHVTVTTWRMNSNIVCGFRCSLYE